MANAASTQAVEIGKEKLRDFLENSETGRQAIGLTGRDSDSISLNTLDSRVKRKPRTEEEDEDDEI